MLLHVYVVLAVPALDLQFQHSGGSISGQREGNVEKVKNDLLCIACRTLLTRNV